MPSADIATLSADITAMSPDITASNGELLDGLIQSLALDYSRRCSSHCPQSFLVAVETGLEKVPISP